MRTVSIIVFVAAAQAFSPGSSAGDVAVFLHPAMGTEFELRIETSPSWPAEALAGIADDVFAELDALEAEISSWRETSLTTYLNRRAHIEEVRVSPATLELFIESRRLSRLTNGAFDPTVGPLLDAWNLREGGEPVGKDAIARARKQVGFRNIRIDELASTIRYRRERVRVDWGAIGKGFALDRMERALRDRGVTRALLSAGTSTVLALDSPRGDSGWEVRIRDDQGTAIDVLPVALNHAALSTSACYGDSDEPCDILDPRTGKPVPAARSATVIAASALEADALSTAMLVMTEDDVEQMFGDRPDLRGILVSFEDQQITHYNRNEQERNP